MMQVWWKDEFDEMDDDERADRAWKVPDEVGILDPSFRYPCKSVRNAAEKYADYFHSDRDGWENTWPLNFVVFDGERYFDVEVDREYVAEFWSSEPTPREITPTADTEENADD